MLGMVAANSAMPNEFAVKCKPVRKHRSLLARTLVATLETGCRQMAWERRRWTRRMRGTLRGQPCTAVKSQ